MRWRRVTGMITLARYPLHRQVIAAAVLLALPLLAGAFWLAQMAHEERTSELREQVAAMAATVRAYLDRHLQAIDSVATALVAHPSVRALDTEASSRLFAALLRDYTFLVNIVVRGRDGSIRGSGLAWSSDLPALSGDQPYVKQVLATGRQAVGEFQVGPLSGRPTIVFAYPILSADGEVTGVLGLGLRLETLQDVFQSIPLPAGSVVTLTDRTSLILARSRDPERFIGTHVDAAPLEPSEAPGIAVRTGVDGLERVFGNVVVDRGPWLLSVGIPTSVAEARVLASWRRSLFLVLAGLAAYLLLTILVSRTITRPLGQLEASARRIAHGDLSAPEFDAASRELADLRDSFVLMAARLREAREAIDRQLAQERRTREELQSLQRHTVRQERLAAVGQLVSGVAHELNNPLQVIIGLIDLLDQQRRVPADLARDLELIRSESLRAGEIVRNLLVFVRQQPNPAGPVDLGEVIASVVRLRERELEQTGVHLTVDAPPSSRPVWAVFSELQQVLLNLVINAEQALEESAGVRRLAIGLADRGSSIHVEVSDSGAGVRTEDEAKLFQPFFTTKPVGQGTGLGLSVSYGIIESYGGTIGYRTNAWGGATFYFELPVAAQDSRDGTDLLHRTVSE